MSEVGKDAQSGLSFPCVPFRRGCIEADRKVSVTRLERFKQAQDRQDSGFECALAEMQTDCKQGHWIWYVFPQLSGLGTSHLSQRYGINDLAEAAEYLHDPVLFS